MKPWRCITLLVFSAILMAVSDDDTLTPPGVDCTFTPEQLRREGPELWHRLSERAEAVAPSAAVSSGKRRAVLPPMGPPFVARNFIDSEIFGKMVKDHVHWTVRSSDAEFLRRVSLDLTGEIPDPDTVKAFLADTAADKRDKAIDRLLNSDAFTDRWTLWFGDLVENVQTATNSTEYYQGRNAYYKFIHDSIQSKKPYDQIVRELISDNGRAFTAGQVNHWVRQIQNNGPIQDTYDNLSASTYQRFLSQPTVCVSCHNGPGHLEQVNTGLAKRLRGDFWKNAAFFAQVTVTREKDVNTNAQESILADNATGQYRLNTTSGNKTPRVPISASDTTAQPAFFLTGETPRDGEPRRVAYARMLTAHPQFARAAVNYLWKQLFGLGIVEPVDSFDLNRQDPATLAPNATLQPTHPQLLTGLANNFASGGYNLRAILKVMVSSNAYQLSSTYDGVWNETYTPYFARHLPHRLMAEQMLDAVFKSTNVGATLSITGSAGVMKAVQLPDTTEGGGAYRVFLNNFGRGNRDEQPRSSDSSIVQALALMNDRIVTDRVKSTAKDSTVQKLLAASKDPATIAQGLYLATLGRYPTVTERLAAVSYLGSGDVTKKTEDLQFSLLNRLEFLFN
jgi:hypothetical protein